MPDSPIGHLTMLKLPDDEFVALELVHDPVGDADTSAPGFSHFAVQVESLDATVARLAAAGIQHRRRSRRRHRTCTRPPSPIPTVARSSSSSGRPATPTA